MDARTRTIADMAAVLSTLNEEPDGELVACTSIYLALGSDHDRYTRVMGILRQQGLVKWTAQTVKITDEGRTKAREIEERLKAIGIDITEV